MHLKLDTERISQLHKYLVLFFLTSKQYTRFSADLSWPNMIFSEPSIIKYPPASYLHSPVSVFSKCLY